jgi:2-(1,2-epoxy-1,2-dihydrophenyl)acetyl-CoA isomerase
VRSAAGGFISVGLVPDTGASYFVARLLGYARAFEWLCSGRRLSAADAHAWGLVAEVVEDGRLQARAAQVAATFASLPTRAIGMTKRLLERAPLSTLAEQLELEAQLQAGAARSEDFEEGVAAFLEKRDPRFTGR